MKKINLWFFLAIVISILASAWLFDFRTGYNDWGSKDNGLCAWAVRDGDVAPIPEPSTILLLCFGFIGFLGFKKKLHK